MLFVLIACGAVSGFHSLVAGGTTSKQLGRESDGRKIGYGPMIVEAGLAGLVVLLAAGALRWDPLGADRLSLQYLMDPAGGGGPIVAFATGFSEVVRALPGLTPAVGLFFGMLMINAFVITTLDTSTRLGRFICQELGGSVPLLRSRLGSTLVTVIAAGWLGASDSYTAIWPVFGATNQLVAALTLIFVTAWLVARGRPRWYTLGPAIFMLVTCCGALVYQGIGFLRVGKSLLAAISLGLLALALFLAWEVRAFLFGRGRQAASAESAGAAEDAVARAE
jgi:carbon starvation protein